MFTYNIINIKCSTATGRKVVKEFILKITCEHNNQTDFSLVPIYVTESDTFTPYEELTEQQLIDWAFDCLSNDELEAIKNGLLSVLESSVQVYQTQEPWVK